MNKQEFLDKLRLALNGRVSAGIVADNIRYYEDYINTEIRKGRSEEEVLSQLGDPRLIARTIVQTHGGTGGGRAADMNGDARSFSSQDTDRSGKGQENGGKNRSFSFRLPIWIIGIVAVIVIGLVLVLVLSFVFSVMSVVLPVILIIVAVTFVVKLFRDWLN